MGGEIMDDIKLNKEQMTELLKSGSIFLGKYNKSLDLIDKGKGLEFILNWQGYGYRPTFLILGGLEYDEKIKFSESED